AVEPNASAYKTPSSVSRTRRIASSMPSGYHADRRSRRGGRLDQRRPFAIRTDSGRVRRRALEMTPNSGPSAGTANAHDQPAPRPTGGTSQIETIVRAKPAQVWVVRAVPT